MTRTIAEEIQTAEGGEERSAPGPTTMCARRCRRLPTTSAIPFYLSKLAVGLEAQTIVMCGVSLWERA